MESLLPTNTRSALDAGEAEMDAGAKEVDQASAPVDSSIPKSAPFDEHKTTTLDSVAIGAAASDAATGKCHKRKIGPFGNA